MVIENKELSKLVDVIVNKIFPQKIVLFGSRATNHARQNSDYDIFILVNHIKNTRAIERKLYYLMAKERISIPVDLIVETVDKFERLKNNPYLLYNQVDKFGKTIYGI